MGFPSTTYECRSCGKKVVVVGESNSVLCICNNPMWKIKEAEITGPTSLWKTIKYK